MERCCGLWVIITQLSESKAMCEEKRRNEVKKRGAVIPCSLRAYAREGCSKVHVSILVS